MREEDVLSKPELAAMANVTEQDAAKANEIEVSKQDWKQWGLSLQEAVNYVRYDLVEPPEPGKRGTLVIARKRSRDR